MSIQLGRGGRPLRIGFGRIFHEANAFSPIPTTEDAFKRFHHVEGPALKKAAGIRGSEIPGYLAHAELTGFLQAARAAGGVEAVPLTSSLTVPGGPLTRGAFEWLLTQLLTSIERAGKLDGVYLALHGSMEVLDLDEAPEAMIIRRVKEVAGPDVKIAVSYDLHANLSSGLVEPVDVMVAYRTNPHWDLAPTGFRAGNRLIRILRGHATPVHAWRKLPMVLGGGITIDFLSPMRAIFKQLRALEDDERVLSASLFMVHPYTSADDLGWAVHVSTDGNPALANELVERLADLAWSVKDVRPPPMRTVEEAIEEAARSRWRHLGPVTFIDVDDIVGAGAPGGNTHVVQGLVRNDRGLKAYVPLHDPLAVDAIWNSREGSVVTTHLSGTPGYHQPQCSVTGKIAVKRETDFGRTVRLDVGPWHLAITERSPLPIHPKFWRELGLRARDADVIVQKNFFHYRIFYAATSFQHLPVVSQGATSLKKVGERMYPTPRHPRDPVQEWRAWDHVLRTSPRRHAVLDARPGTHAGM